MSKTNTAENRAVDTTPAADGIIEAINRVQAVIEFELDGTIITCLLYTSPSPRDRQKSRMPSSA